MRYLSICSGIEAASTAWMPLGWQPVAFSEVEPFPCSVLAHHHPDVPNWGDMTKYEEWPDVPIDLLCGGTPCQSFSVAGLRKGLADPRGNLMLTFGAIAAKYRPRWLVWENVPGVLSSNGGRDFGTFLGLLAELGYGFAYRVLDAQYVRVESHPRAVPQRRRRVFVVGHSGGLWQRAAAVLFERESLCGHPAPRREAGQVAPTIPARSTAGGGLGTDFDCDGGTICVATGQAGAEIGADMAPTLSCNHEAPYVVRTLLGKSNCSHAEDKETYVCFDTTQITSAANYSNPKPGDPCHPLAAGAHAPAIAFAIQAGALRTNPESGPRGMGVQAGHAYTLEARAEVQAVAYTTTKLHNTASNQAGKVYQEYTASLDNSSPPPALLTSTAVRRLTPLEAERLMGFPDGHTAIPHKGKPASECPDGPRYKSLGNSWAVPVARWIGERIEAVETIVADQAELETA